MRGRSEHPLRTKEQTVLNRRALLGIVLPATAGLVLSACGSSAHDGMDMGSSASPNRTVNVQMTDLAFSTATISVKAGETVKFVFQNNGKVRHDAFIGDTAAQVQHGMEMRSGPGSMPAHDMNGSDGVTVQPGTTGELTMTFDKAGPLELGCHEPGHYEAGMKAMVDVS
jgi:uncharacterized cupredoxin-like copper-binding protein